MPELDDIALLKQFAEKDSEPAFAGIVSRHLNLVYSTALRRTGNAHAAQEISQAVFIILARKAKSLGAKTILSGWLHQTARLTAANYVRGEIRRQKHEQETFMQSTLNKSAHEAWLQIAPVLDGAISKLGAKDRDAIVLRFFENKSLGEVGAALCASEDAAKMRVNRALEKLRKFFAKRGVTFSAAVIAGAVSANSVQAAPVGLAKTISAVAIAKGAAAGGSTLALVKGALKIMAWTKAKTAVIAGVVLILAAGTTTVIVKSSGHHPKVKLQWTPAEKESFQQESIARLNHAKEWALASIMFADDHQNQLPKNLEQMKTYASKDALSDSNWEIVSRGSLTSIAKPAQTILLREKESRQSPDGKFVKTYAFADGHAELQSSPDNDFAALEKQRGFLVQPGK
jgi:RNA polymerase sigma factor (sigma-70 family)